jgi:pyridoxal 5'-phosphate synthase pdxS subunit
MIPFNNFRLVVNVKNLSEALKAQEANADAILLYDKIPDTIIELEVSGPQFRSDIVKDIIENVSIPLIVRVRIGNLVEINMLKKMGVKYFYEVNIVKKNDQIIKYSLINDEQYTSMCAISDFEDIVNRLKDGYHMFKISGKTISDILVNCKNIHHSIKYIYKLTRTQLLNYSKTQDISLQLCEYISLHHNIPGAIYISKINNYSDFELIKEDKTIGYLINGIVLENNIFLNDNDKLNLDNYRLNQ